LLNPDYRDMLSAFTDEGVEYLIVGAYALAIHGLPRATDGIERSVLSKADQIANMRAVGRPQDLADANRLDNLGT
jgi:hypothetical protein